MRIEDLLRLNALARRDAPAIECELTSLTWGDLDADANRVANAFRDHAHREQERVAIVLPNCHTIPITYFGLWKRNLVTVAINPRMTSPEIAQIVRHAGASALVAGTAEALEAAAEVDTVRTVVTVGDVESDGHSLKDILATGDPTDPPRLGHGTDLRSLRYTSGTTGHPKGCMATHEQQLASVHNYIAQIAVPRDRPTYLSVPMTLGVGAFYLTVAAALGAPLLVRRRFDVDGFLDDIAARDVAHAFLVPTMLIDLEQRLAEDPSLTADGLELLGYGGAQIPWSLIESLRRRLGCRMYQGLGATEAGGYVTLMTPGDHEQIARSGAPSPIASVGRRAAYAEVAILDEGGQPVATGETGELRIRSASTFSGYWAQPELTRTTLRNGWLALGDIAWQDERGFIFLVDRKGGVIRSGSQNVYPTEVEAVLNTHPSVTRAAVLGVVDERYGQRVEALVVPADPGVRPEVLLEYCAERLATHKRPRAIHLTPELPFDEGGKLQRTALPHLHASHVEATPEELS